MTSPATPGPSKSADDGVRSDDAVPLIVAEGEQGEDKTPSSSPFVMISSDAGEACGPDGCTHLG